MYTLVNKTINNIKMANDNKAILFITTDGDVVAKCDGDCCSETWIYNISLPALGFPALVLSVDNLDLGESKDDYEVIQFYGCKITTNKGEILIEYRNLSNGYYGGSLTWPGDYHYGGVNKQNNSTEQWEEIINDV